ncbi:MAG: alkaline phosphatase, partial [Verrucomicrobiaceae bacterium]
LMAGAAHAAPVISRLTPPSALFSFNDPSPPYIARFLPGQRFDFDATVQPDSGQTITKVEFKVNGVSLGLSSPARGATGLAANSVCVAKRAISFSRPGVYTFTATATQSDSQVITKSGNFEVVNLNARLPGQSGSLVKAKNIIFCIGDGMGIAHRTAARIMLQGVQQGKALGQLAMDKMPNVALINTHSLNSIVTDSSPGAACYSTGNKSNNNQHGVFPDDTTDNFDNPRQENIGEYFYRTQGKTLGIVTTSDVFDATPASFATHTQSRSAGTGICDQYFDERNSTGLRVLMGGGRKWFLPSTTNGSARSSSTDYAGSDVQGAWNVAGGVLDSTRDLLADFQSATKGNFYYAPDKTGMDNMPAGTERLLGLFAMSQMNVAKDKIDKRRGNSTIVDDYGFPDQPMLDEMTDKALQVLSTNKKGFVLMVEAASIDKQAHNMDSERWMLDTIEFDHAIEKCRQFALKNPDTLVIVTADHECAGVNIIGASTVDNATLTARAATPGIGAGADSDGDGTVDTAVSAAAIATSGSPVVYSATATLATLSAGQVVTSTNFPVGTKVLSPVLRIGNGSIPAIAAAATSATLTVPSPQGTGVAVGALISGGTVPSGALVTGSTATSISISFSAIATAITATTNITFTVQQIALDQNATASGADTLGVPADVVGLRTGVVGLYESASFPQYSIAADGYPVSTDPDYKMLIGYAANADRYEDWLTNSKPLVDTQQPQSILNTLSAASYPAAPMNRDTTGGFLITGQIPGTSAAHTASDIPLSAMGRGASLFGGVMDNTDVFFQAVKAVVVGAPK